MTKDDRAACAICGGIKRLEIHHVNENHFDNSTGNRMSLCKYCHQQVTDLGPGLSEHLIELARNNPGIRAQIRESSAKRLGEYKDSNRGDTSPARQLTFDFDGSNNDDGYQRPPESRERIQAIVKGFVSPLKSRTIQVDGWIETYIAGRCIRREPSFGSLDEHHWLYKDQPTDPMPTDGYMMYSV